MGNVTGMEVVVDAMSGRNIKESIKDTGLSQYSKF